MHVKCVHYVYVCMHAHIQTHIYMGTLFALFVEKIIKCDTPCENGGNCSGLELCDCTKDYYGQHCDSKSYCAI